MNRITILVASLALVIGGFAGYALTGNNDESADMRGQGGGANAQMGDFKPESMDFVSARPEVSSLPVGAISEDEEQNLLLMREEEKLARDVYTTLYDQWGLKIFTNIAQSEQTHTEAVRDLLVKYDIADPVTNDTVGVFKSDEMQELYDTLVAQGAESEIEALKVRALIEDLDIFDLQKSLLETDNADITLVYENLERGSRNHLRAFMSQLESRGGDYEAQYLTQSEFDEIKDSERERGDHGGQQGEGGHGDGESKGGGRGWGGGGGGRH